jgi:uncharacterized protein YlxW (UPF0749 family)
MTDTGAIADRVDPATPPKPLDASMDLLNQIIRQPVDPDYALVAARGGPPARSRGPLALVAVLIGVMFAVAALQTTRSAPALESERGELINRVRAGEREQDRLRATTAELSTEIDRLRTTALGGDDEALILRGQIDRLGPVVGAVAVTGPGLLIVVDDAPVGSTDARDRVLDIDLQVLANGLWQAGAEAVAINGHRLSNLTAIRSAGDAITVDFRSLTRPYRVEAIGDPRTLPARFADTTAGAWWHELAANRQMTYETSTAESLTLPADPGMVLRHARRAVL